MTDSIDSVYLQNVEVQSNGIIRNEKGRLIARLVGDVDYRGEHVTGVACPTHHEASPNVEEWEKEFDEDYDITNVNEWTLGIVASAMFHKQTASIGADASHITVKLRKLVESLLLQKDEQQKKEGEEAYRQGQSEARAHYYEKVSSEATLTERNRIVKVIDKLLKDSEKYVPFQKIHYQSALSDIIEAIK